MKFSLLWWHLFHWKRAACYWRLRKLCTEEFLEQWVREQFPSFIKKKWRGNVPGTYSLSLSFGTRYGRRGDFSYLYWDASFGFILLCDSQPIAMVAFEPWGNSLTIKQIQGVKNYGHRLNRIRWEHFLVRFVIALAKKFEVYDEVRIISGRSCLWYEDPHTNLSLDYSTVDEVQEEVERIRESMEHRYFTTATTLGFQFKVPHGYYFRTLTAD